MSRAAVGIAEHNGWANLVTVMLEDGAPIVLDRRRAELLDGDLPPQPYHHETLQMPADAADSLVTLVKASAAGCAAGVLTELATAIAPRCMLATIAIRTPPIDALPATVAEVHSSRRVMLAADAMIYHDALCQAARRLGLGVVLVARRTELERAGGVLGLSPAETVQLLDRVGQTAGPPWRDEHKFAAAAAIAALKR